MAVNDSSGDEDATVEFAESDALPSETSEAESLSSSESDEATTESSEAEEELPRRSTRARKPATKPDIQKLGGEAVMVPVSMSQ